MENILLKEENGFWIQFDLSKAFDRFSWSVIFHVLIECGFPTQIVGLIKHAWTSMRRRFKLALGSVGDEWAALNGALQGDPNSVWVTNVLWKGKKKETKEKLPNKKVTSDSSSPPNHEGLLTTLVL